MPKTVNHQAVPYHRCDLSADRARALALTPVSRETLERLDRFVELLLSWQRTVPLIGASTVPNLWTRHIADSLQLIDLAPEARVGSTSAPAADFPAWSSPARSPARRMRSCIWLKATPERPPSCAKLAASPERRPSSTRCGSSISWTASGIRSMW